LEPPVTDPLTYVLSSLRRAAEEGFPWGVLPNEADALVAEVERLRAQRALDNDDLARAYDMGRDKERAAVVAWLREPGEYVDPACARLADCIERGEHRRKGEP
jgi:hypothetical protein